MKKVTTKGRNKFNIFVPCVTVTIYFPARKKHKLNEMKGHMFVNSYELTNQFGDQYMEVQSHNITFDYL